MKVSISSYLVSMLTFAKQCKNKKSEFIRLIILLSTHEITNFIIACVFAFLFVGSLLKKVELKKNKAFLYCTFLQLKLSLWAWALTIII